MNFNLSIKALSVIVLISAGIGAGSVLYFQKPIIVEKTVTVTKTEQKFIYNPATADFNTLQLWAKSPIQIEYTLGKQARDYTAVSVHAFDANKETREEIRVPIYQNADWKVYAGIGAGVAVATIMGFECWRKRAR